MNAELCLFFIFEFVSHHRLVLRLIKLQLFRTYRLKIIEVWIPIIKVFGQVKLMDHFPHPPFFIDLLSDKRVFERRIPDQRFGLFVLDTHISHFYWFLHIFKSINNGFIFYHFFLSRSGANFVREQIFVFIIIKGLVVILALFFSTVIFIFHGLGVDHNYFIAKLDFFEVLVFLSFWFFVFEGDGVNVLETCFHFT